MTAIKHKNRERLLSVNEERRACLSETWPKTQALYRHRQADVRPELLNYCNTKHLYFKFNID